MTSGRKVDRTDFKANFDGRVGDDVFDIGWADGVLTDGRPYVLASVDTQIRPPVDT